MSEETGKAKAPVGGKPKIKVQNVFGLCWFHRDDFEAARKVMADPDALFDTYDEWLAAAKAIEKRVTDGGDKVVRIRFDLEAFLLYCGSRGIPAYEQARADWAGQEVRKKFLGK